MLRNNADARRCSYLELGLPVTAVACVKKDPIGLESIMNTENFEY